MHEMLVHLGDLADKTTGRHHFVALGEAGNTFAVLLLLATSEVVAIADEATGETFLRRDRLR